MENNARTTNSNKIIHKYLGGYFVFVLVAMSFLSGLYVGNKQNRTVSPDPLDGEDVQVIGDGRALDIDDLPEYLKHDVDFNLYWKVWNTIKESFVDNTIPETQLFYGSLRGMVDSLDDPYSLFLTPDITQRFTAELQGEFQGIGAEISIRNDILTVIAPLSGTPASKAGLRAGDMILEIDGQDTSGMFLDEAVTKIRGVGGTAVVLTIYREGFSEPKKFEIIRDTIIVNSVVWEVRKDGLGYVKISHFNENTSQLWNEAVRELLSADVSGVIVDLRNNPGGFLDTAIEVSSEWLEDGVVVSEVGRDGEKFDYETTGSAQFAGMRTIVLINEGSASGSEILAGAVQDLGKAKLVGSTSFGKGSVQDYQVLPDGSSLKLTIAKWLTPKGRQIDGIGIDPDVAVAFTEEDFNAGLDPQLDVAVKILLDPTYVYVAPEGGEQE